ncbi:MAG: ABC transporter permease [Pseudobdellovibrionaceae bacterium]
MKKLSLFFLICLGLGTFWSFLNLDAGTVTDVNLALEKPSLEALLGRDSLGRDLLMRILQGAQVSVGLGIASSLMALLIGFSYGAFSALGTKSLDHLLMRVAEVLMSLPSLMLMAVLAMVLQTQIFESNLVLIFWVLALGSWMPIARLTRNLIVKEKSQEYAEAARAIGAGPVRIFLKHLLPNLASPLIVYWSLQVPHALLAEGLLSFLGFGVKSPGVSWGALLQEGWKTLAQFPHLLLAPSAFLFLTILSINFLLEDFRKSMDPKLKWEKLP